jgi:hypothetical protein
MPSLMGLSKALCAGVPLLCSVLAWSMAAPVRAQTDAARSAPQEQPAQDQLASQPPKARLVLLQIEGAPARSALEPSLRIQLRELELVTERSDLPPDVPSRIAAANRIASERSADWVIWADELRTDPSKPADQAVLYVVGRKDGRALIEIVRVPGGEGPEVDRSLALKVRELVGAQDGAAYALGNKDLPPPVAATEPNAVQPEPSPRRASGTRLSIEAGVQVSDEGSAGLSADLFLALAPSLRTDALVIAVPLELAFGLPRSSELDGARVEWSEIGVAVWLKIGARIHPSLTLGGGFGGKLGFTDAQGTSASGETGSSTERLPALLVSLDGELALSETIAARLTLGLESRLRRQRFLIEEREVGDTGRAVPFGRASVAWHL